MKFYFNTIELNDVNISATSLILRGRSINNISTVDKPIKNSLVFINYLTDAKLRLLDDLNESLIIINTLNGINNSVTEKNDVIICQNPRLTYAIVLQYALNKSLGNRKLNHIGDNIYIGEDVKLGSNVNIEPNVTIGHRVIIGDNTRILSGVRIGNDVVIGNDCIIRNNTVVGGYGFGTEKDEDGKTYRIPHLGSVRMGNNVDIGSLNTVVSGTIEPTIVEDNVMTDDHVHIAHNCHIGNGTFITACVEISGSVTIGRNSYIGPNSSIINKINLGENTTVGIASVVTKSFEGNKTLAGNPADTIENFKYNRNIMKKILLKQEIDYE